MPNNQRIRDVANWTEPAVPNLARRLVLVAGVGESWEFRSLRSSADDDAGLVGLVPGKERK